MSDQPVINPKWVLMVGVFAVSTGAIFVRLAEAPALVVAAYRLGLAMCVLIPTAGWRSRHELTAIARRDFLLALLAGFFLALHFATWISSLSYTSVANSVVLVNTNPLWVGLLTPFVTQDRIRRATIYAIVLSVVGGAIIGWGDFHAGGNALWGDFLALCGSICMACYILLGRNLRPKLSLSAYVVVCYGTAAVVLWVMVLATGMPVSGFSPTTWAALWGMALVSQIVGHSSYNWALKWFSANLIAVTLLGEPVFSTLMAYLFFGEGLTWFKVVGGGLILGAIYLAAKEEAV